MAAKKAKAPVPPDEQLTPALLKLALVVIVGTFTVQLDATMMNVAINTLRQDFNTSVTTIQWVVASYLLAMAVTIPLAGWAVDRFGARKAWLSALGVFLLGSVLCAVAWNVGSLIGFRILQGVGGGILLPLSQAILAQAAGPKRLGRLMAVVGIPALLGPVLGPIIGGILVNDLGWRWIFYINIPVAVAAIAMTLRYMQDTAPTRRSRLDVIGLALISPALAGIVYGLEQTGNAGGFASGKVLIPLIGGVVLLVLFGIRSLTTRGEPIIDLRLFRSRNFAASSTMLFFVTVSLIGTLLILPLYFQMARGDSPLRAGLLMAPQGVAAAISIAMCGGIVDRFSARPIAVTGVLLVAVGLVGYTRVGESNSILLISGAQVLTGLGFGAVIVPATAVGFRGLQPQAIGRASVSLRIVQQVASSFGVALLAVELQRQIVRVTAGTAHPSSTELARAYGNVFWWAVAFTLAALPAALALRSRSGPAPANAPAPADAAPLADGASLL